MLVGVEGMRAAALWVAALAGLVCVASSSKEFADCGSTSLTPLKLELDPDPAEVRPTRTAPPSTPPSAHSCLPGGATAGQPAARVHRHDGGREDGDGRQRPRHDHQHAVRPPATAGAPGWLG